METHLFCSPTEPQILEECLAHMYLKNKWITRDWKKWICYATRKCFQSVSQGALGLYLPAPAELIPGASRPLFCDWPAPMWPAHAPFRPFHPDAFSLAAVRAFVSELTFTYYCPDLSLGAGPRCQHRQHLLGLINTDNPRPIVLA